MPTIKAIVDAGVPTFGICLGHQMLGLALGGKTTKMRQGHHGANHPVKDFTTGKVEIVSMNHGFALDRDSLPENVEETHVSLFDGSNCGIRMNDKPVFSVQYHPEASPGPQDSHYLFKRFVELMREKKAELHGKGSRSDEFRACDWRIGYITAIGRSSPRASSSCQLPSLSSYSIASVWPGIRCSAATICAALTAASRVRKRFGEDIAELVGPAAVMLDDPVGDDAHRFAPCLTALQRERRYGTPVPRS